MTIHEIFFLVFSFLLGSIPFGFMICFLKTRRDIRDQGSGNIGAANVLRNLGRELGFLTLVLDLLKGAIPVYYGLSHFNSPYLVLAGGAAAVTGHSFSLFLKFRGGKGVATYLGLLLAFNPPAAALFVAGFFAVFALTGFVSAGSITAILLVFFFFLFTQTAEISMIILFATILIISRHRKNIRSLINGTENKLRIIKNG